MTKWPTSLRWPRWPGGGDLLEGGLEDHDDHDDQYDQVTKRWPTSPIDQYDLVAGIFLRVALYVSKRIPPTFNVILFSPSCIITDCLETISHKFLSNSFKLGLLGSVFQYLPILSDWIGLLVKFWLFLAVKGIRGHSGCITDIHSQLLESLIDKSSSGAYHLWLTGYY